MAQNYQYCYVELDPTTNMVIGMHSGTTESDNPYFVSVPVYDEEYIFKYYNWSDGKFYYDPEYTQEFISALL